MNEQLLKKILELGLAEKEAKVYLATLELGSTGASGISKKAEVDRVNTYNMLAVLKEKGLISEVERRGVKYFSAESPEKLLDLGEETKAKLEKTLGTIKSQMPELLSLFQTGAVRKPRVRFYEGKKGYLSVYEGILDDKPKEFLVIVDYAQFKKLLDEKYEEAWIKRRIELGVIVRWLDFDSPAMRRERDDTTKTLRSIKFLPDEYKCDGGVFAYNNKLIFLSTKEEFMAIVIESEEFAGLGKTLFEILWKFAAK